MTPRDPDARPGHDIREQLAAALPEHQSWCHAEAHGDCCHGECDCGVADALDRLEALVVGYGNQRAAEALESAADDLPGRPSTNPAGRCDENRQLTTPLGVIRCPECHPLAAEEPA